MSEIVNRQIVLAARPQGWPKESDFRLESAPVAPLADGQFLARNVFMSVDPYMRGRMNDAKSYVPPFELGKALDGGAVGEVVESTVDTFRPGDAVLHPLGWREYAVLDARGATGVDLNLVPAGAYLGAL